MIAFVILLVGLYVYFVTAIVWDAANREEILSQASELSSNVSTLETQYVNLSGKVTLDSARILGFVETGNQSGFALARPNLVINN
jgi:hypothetical protein